jgi:hypothetical protein
MKTGKTERVIEPVGGREKQRGQNRGERELALVEMGDGVG